MEKPDVVFGVISLVSFIVELVFLAITNLKAGPEKLNGMSLILVLF
jgi:hypothetical protein